MENSYIKQSASVGIYYAFKDAKKQEPLPTDRTRGDLDTRKFFYCENGEALKQATQ